MRTTPYHVDVPSFGDWGFVLAAPGRRRRRWRCRRPAPPLRFLDAATLAAAATFPPDRARDPVAASTLMDPILDYAREEWVGY